MSESPPRPRFHSGFSLQCPSCQCEIDIPEDTYEIPPHPGHESARVTTYPIGEISAAPTGSRTLARRCEWSGATIQD